MLIAGGANVKLAQKVILNADWIPSNNYYFMSSLPNYMNVYSFDMRSSLYYEFEILPIHVFNSNIIHKVNLKLSVSFAFIRQ